ncbi:MAG: hypothetical protein QOF89_1996 [Acidobacteriota bacterium]|jgi:hypothetical protein|nr:hypothetical protein [Acidobacteriota bacterium]
MPSSRPFSMHIVDFGTYVLHVHLTANDPSSVTRPTRAFDCNLDAMAGFAAAHG